MADDTPVLEESARNTEAEVPETNNRGNFTRNLNVEADEAIAKKMFFGGLLLLPWLHAVNIIFYRKQFFDPSIDPRVTLCKCSTSPWILARAVVCKREIASAVVLMVLRCVLSRGASFVHEFCIHDRVVRVVGGLVPAQVEGFRLGQPRDGAPS